MLDTLSKNLTFCTKNVFGILLLVKDSNEMAFTLCKKVLYM